MWTIRQTEVDRFGIEKMQFLARGIEQNPPIAKRFEMRQQPGGEIEFAQLRRVEVIASLAVQGEDALRWIGEQRSHGR